MSKSMLSVPNKKLTNYTKAKKDSYYKKVTIVDKYYQIDFKLYDVGTVLTFQPLTEGYLKREAEWLKKFNSCKNLSKNQALQTEVQHLIFLCSGLFREHYACTVHDRDFYEYFEIDYYALADRSQSMRKMIGFDLNTIEIFGISIDTNWLMLRNYTLEPVFTIKLIF